MQNILIDKCFFLARRPLSLSTHYYSGLRPQLRFRSENPDSDDCNRNLKISVGKGYAKTLIHIVCPVVRMSII